MQLRLFITFFLLCFHGFTYGQKTVISNFPLSVNTKAFATLQEKVFASYLLLDSIEAIKINDKGVIFFKFNIISGKIKNLNQSGSAPDFFKENIAKYLLNINDLIFGNIPIYKNEVFIYIGLVILFQPFVKIALGRSLWNIVDLVVGVGLLFSIFISNEKLKK